MRDGSHHGRTGRLLPRCLLPIRLIRSGSTRSLLVERLTIPYAAAEELRPIGDDRQWIRLLGQQRPQSRMMPAQFVARAVAMPANTLPEPSCFGEELVT